MSCKQQLDESPNTIPAGYTLIIWTLWNNSFFFVVSSNLISSDGRGYRQTSNLKNPPTLIVCNPPPISWYPACCIILPIFLLATKTDPFKKKRKTGWMLLPRIYYYRRLDLTVFFFNQRVYLIRSYCRLFSLSLFWRVCRCVITRSGSDMWRPLTNFLLLLPPPIYLSSFYPTSPRLILSDCV